MDSVWDTLAGGFPHSEISGSRCIGPLPGAFRRLSRLSSPVVAKASTVCACSLDPLTRTPVVMSTAWHWSAESNDQRFGDSVTGGRLGLAHYLLTSDAPFRASCFAPSSLLKSRFAGFPSKTDSVRAGWWSQAGSNRRPPACKADALPAELWPHILVGLGGLEPPTSPLSGVRSNRLSYRPALGCDLQVIGGGSQFGQTTR